MIYSFLPIRLAFISILFCSVASAPIWPVHAGETAAGNVKKAGQVVSRDTADETVKGNQRQEFIDYKELPHRTVGKDVRPQIAGFIRLKPKLEDSSVVNSQKIFDVEFMGDEASGRKAKKDTDGSPYLKFEKIEDPEKNNALIRKEATKDYRTEVSMGFKISPFSEIYLGKGFLVEQKENIIFDPHDNGWRLKFKLDF